MINPNLVRVSEETTSQLKGMAVLDEIKNIMSKVKTGLIRSIGMIRRLQALVCFSALMSIVTTLVTVHLGALSTTALIIALAVIWLPCVGSMIGFIEGVLAQHRMLDEITDAEVSDVISAKVLEKKVIGALKSLKRNLDLCRYIGYVQILLFVIAFVVIRV